MIILYTLLKNLPAIAISLVGIGFIIGFHEFGHFIFCKIFGVKTPSFSIGFGPQLFKRKIGETEFSLSAIPFGGYVEIAGNQEVGQGEQAEAQRKDEQSFTSKAYYKKLLILSGGIFFNILMSYFVMVLLFQLGAPRISLLTQEPIPPMVEQVTKESIAAKSGLLPGDSIVGINQAAINSTTDFMQALKDQSPTKGFVLNIIRDNSPIQVDIKPIADSKEQASPSWLGIQFATTFDAPLSFWKSVKKSFHSVNQILVKTAKQYQSLFKERKYDSVGGPIRLIYEMVNNAKHGLRIFLLLLVIVSLNLAILNLIPIPIFDGGQILFVTIEALIGRTIPDPIRIGIHYVCWILVIILFLYLSYKDLFKLLVK